MTLDAVSKLAKKHGWEALDYQESIKMASFLKEGCRINIYLTTGTVATCLNHPTKGKTQLFRRNVTHPLLEKIMTNPRHHTRRGYYRK